MSDLAIIYLPENRIYPDLGYPFKVCDDVNFGNPLGVPVALQMPFAEDDKGPSTSNVYRKRAMPLHNINQITNVRSGQKKDDDGVPYGCYIKGWGMMTSKFFLFFFITLYFRRRRTQRPPKKIKKNGCSRTISRWNYFWKSKVYTRKVRSSNLYSKNFYCFY